MSEDFGGLEDEGPSNAGGRLDVVTKYAYDSSLNQCREHIVRSAELHLEFWNQLNRD